VTSYPWRVACFDLDGTLVPGTTVSQPLAELEQRYRAAEISNVEVARRQAAHLIGRHVDELVEAIASIPRIDSNTLTTLLPLLPAGPDDVPA
jgi:phosphoserine phosphatase